MIQANGWSTRTGKVKKILQDYVNECHEYITSADNDNFEEELMIKQTLRSMEFEKDK